MANLGSVTKWFENKGDYTHRLNYNLNEDSVVFDLGGYEGWFVEQMVNKFNCNVYCFEPLQKFSAIIEKKFIGNNKVHVYTMGISNEIKKSIIYLNKDASSTNIKNGKAIEIKLTRIDKIMSENNIKFVDLIKLNIEGDEYDVLDYIINNQIQENFGDIQVQFHKIGNFQERYNNIKKELEKTHELTYYYPFVWENWKLK